MRSPTDKFALIAGEYISSGAPLQLPVDQLWPELLTWHEGQWERVPAEGFNVFKLMQLAAEKDYTTPFWLTLRSGEQSGGQLRPTAEGTHIADWRQAPASDTWSGDLPPSHVRARPAPAALASDDASAVGLRPVVVFHASEWLDLPALPGFVARQVPSREEALERAQQIERLGAGCEIKHGGAAPFYNPSLNYISLPHPEDFPSLRAYYTALFQQIGHALASRHQLNLFGPALDAQLSNDVAFKTLYAKLVAAMLAYEAGIDVLE